MFVCGADFSGASVLLNSELDNDWDSSPPGLPQGNGNCVQNYIANRLVGFYF